MKNKQTAVEWLVQYVHSEQYQKAFGQTYISIELLEQAKAIEKEQMFSYTKQRQIIGEYSMKFFTEDFEQYYNETYEK
jgi:hypothetical protein